MEQGIEHLPDASRGGQGRDVGLVNLFAGGLASCACLCPMQTWSKMMPAPAKPTVKTKAGELQSKQSDDGICLFSTLVALISIRLDETSKHLPSSGASRSVI